MPYVQKNNPFPTTPCGRRRAGGIASGFKKAEPRRTIGKGKNFNPVAKDKSATGGAAGGGMTEKVYVNINVKILVVNYKPLLQLNHLN